MDAAIHPAIEVACGVARDAAALGCPVQSDLAGAVLNMLETVHEFFLVAQSEFDSADGMAQSDGDWQRGSDPLDHGTGLSVDPPRAVTVTDEDAVRVRESLSDASQPEIQLWATIDRFGPMNQHEIARAFDQVSVSQSLRNRLERLVQANLLERSPGDRHALIYSVRTPRNLRDPTA